MERKFIVYLKDSKWGPWNCHNLKSGNGFLLLIDPTLGSSVGESPPDFLVPLENVIKIEAPEYGEGLDQLVESGNGRRSVQEGPIGSLTPDRGDSVTSL